MAYTNDELYDLSEKIDKELYKYKYNEGIGASAQPRKRNTNDANLSIEVKIGLYLKENPTENTIWEKVLKVRDILVNMGFNENSPIFINITYVILKHNNFEQYIGHLYSTPVFNKIRYSNTSLYDLIIHPEIVRERYIIPKEELYVLHPEHEQMVSGLEKTMDTYYNAFKERTLPNGIHYRLEEPSKQVYTQMETKKPELHHYMKKLYVEIEFEFDGEWVGKEEALKSSYDVEVNEALVQIAKNFIRGGIEIRFL